MRKGIVTLGSLAIFCLIGNSLDAQETGTVRPDVIRVSAMSDSVFRYMVNTNQVYEAGLDTFPQIVFWRKVMNLPPDSGLVSLASNRTIYCCMSDASWAKMGETGQTKFRDSLRAAHGLPDSASVLYTKGKNDFYNAKSVISDIDKSIPIFVQHGVDPFYAQAILLIESPGKVRKSPVGAMGPFQLMRSVAISMGLKVNKSVDERKNLEKSAWAAAKLIRTVCIPYTNAMLEKRGIAYDTTALWYRLLVLHSYHAGAGNVEKALTAINPCEGGMQLIQQLWQTKAGAFGRSSQAYSQLAVSAILELDMVMGRDRQVALAPAETPAEGSTH